MIFGHIANLDKEYHWLPKALKYALAHLKQTDLKALPAGNYELQGRKMFVQVFDIKTKEFAQCRPEVHRKYLDIHYVVSGKENMGFALETGNNQIHEDLLEEKDLLFYQDAENEVFFTMFEDNFAIFFPGDVHRPACAVSQPMDIRKIVLKVHLSLLED